MVGSCYAMQERPIIYKHLYANKYDWYSDALLIAYMIKTTSFEDFKKKYERHYPGVYNNYFNECAELWMAYDFYCKDVKSLFTIINGDIITARPVIAAAWLSLVAEKDKPAHEQKMFIWAADFNHVDTLRFLVETHNINLNEQHNKYLTSLDNSLEMNYSINNEYIMMKEPCKGVQDQGIEKVTESKKTLSKKIRDKFKSLLSKN